MSERAVASGDQIRVNYVGKFEDGSIFDSSEGNQPLVFTVGAEQVIPGFDKAVIGMKIFGAGKLTSPEKKDSSLKYVFENKLVDAITIGMMEPKEVGDTIKRAYKALKA